LLAKPNCCDGIHRQTQQEIHESRGHDQRDQASSSPEASTRNPPASSTDTAMVIGRQHTWQSSM
jgi:hypothetical protein